MDHIRDAFYNVHRRQTEDGFEFCRSQSRKLGPSSRKTFEWWLIQMSWIDIRSIWAKYVSSVKTQIQISIKLVRFKCDQTKILTTLFYLKVQLATNVTLFGSRPAWGSLLIKFGHCYRLSIKIRLWILEQYAWVANCETWSTWWLGLYIMLSSSPCIMLNDVSVVFSLYYCWVMLTNEL